MSEAGAAAEAALFRLDLADEDATARLAADLALVLRAGDVVALIGDLGAGKSSFARAFLRALSGDPGLEVPSPTYTLAQSYETTPPATHYDLYRLGDASELDELGLDEAAASGIVLCEWPERAPDLLTRAALQISLTHATGDPSGTRRHAVLEARGEAASRVRRTLELRLFLDGAGLREAHRRPFPGDASARRYESVRPAGGGALRVLMDSPPLVLGPPVRGGRPYAAIAHTALNIVPFVAIAAYLDAGGLLVPRVEACDLGRGFALLDDLGRDGVLDGEGRPIPERYEAAMRALAHLHQRPLPGLLPAGADRAHEVPPFDRDAMQIEASLLPDWYMPALTGAALPEAERARFEAAWDRVFAGLAGAERHILLRDVHSPNLLWQPDGAGLRRIAFLDFQDAMIGPTAYDVASLAQDARADVPAELEARLVASYVAARREADPAFDEAAFRLAYAAMGAQRLTKILGIFVRLARRDGKPQYLRHIPRIKAILARTLRHPALAELSALYDEWRILDPALVPSRIGPP